MKFIITESQLSRIISENQINVIAEMPGLIQELLKNYEHLYSNYDWNEKADEFRGDRYALNTWIDNHEQEEFIKNKTKIIAAIRHDMILERRIIVTSRKMIEFENELVELLGKHVTADANSETINIPEFERFVEQNPRYKKAYDKWMALMDEHTKYTLMDKISLHSISYESLKKLYNYLIGQK